MVVDEITWSNWALVVQTPHEEEVTLQPRNLIEWKELSDIRCLLRGGEW